MISLCDYAALIQNQTNNSQSILVASWSPQHKRNIHCGTHKGYNDEHCKLEIVAEHIAHMV
jgi:hypothetical protein